MNERRDIANCHKGCYPIFTLIIIVLTTVGFFLEMALYEKRQEVIDAYEDFYDFEYPKYHTACTASTEELNNAIKSVRLNYSEKSFLWLSGE